MKYLLSIICATFALYITGCNAGDGGAGGSGGSSAARTSTAVVTATEYCYEFSGNGMTFSADIHGYVQSNYGGAQQNPNPYNNTTLGAATQTYCIPNSPVPTESMIANITVNGGAGTLTIVTKKNGTIFRTDTLTNPNSTTISDAN